ncbi:ADP-glucose transglucosylase [Desulfocucumis palustris]|uniref:Glycogen synthase n=1 Tax=Desulfocucumis palustris TaxID=1898651 RepID=A0A2L2XDJ2_9FIRM|nr:glycogen synthase GlgA [Desulfocucumis palustris]GBF34094.1 ADP-glucose transglucosylase [Desulfocucumis palustris]
MFDRPLKILLVSSEVVPFAKTGGLADVAGSLPKALAVVGNDNMGNDVRVIMPHYKGIEGASYRMDFPVMFNNRAETSIIRESTIEAHFHGQHRIIPVYMVDNHHYFYRDRMYMFPDEAERYTFFCRAVLEMLPRLNWQPDVIHCNDWQSGPIPFFIKTRYRHDPFYAKISTVFTIHNLQYQGNYPRESLRVLGVGDEYFTPDQLEFYGSVSFMKMGLVYSDVINTVSRTYAAEIQRPELGERMDGLLRKRSHDLYGIVNGINYHEFNPKTDHRIYRNYDYDSIEYKKENKYALQKELGLPIRDVPVIGLISRLVDQKGLDLISEIGDELMHLDLHFVVLGSGEKHYEEMFNRLKSKYPQKMGVYIGFNSILAQRIYSGADMFLMPSRFEPCGLGQLIAMRYGTIPIVRATGGLADTVHDYNPATGSGNGFVFSEYNGRALYHAIARSLKVYRDDQEQWSKLARNCMEMDFSWARSGVEYLQLFQEAISRHVGRAQTA